MWEMGKEFWIDKNALGDGSLEPEWSDSALTPEAILSINPLGYELFNKYFAPVLSKPDFNTLRSMFQDNDEGLSGYVSDESAALAQLNGVNTQSQALQYMTDYDRGDVKLSLNGELALTLQSNSLSDIIGSEGLFV